MIDKINRTAYSRILETVTLIPPGRVATYGQVAELAGYPRGARLTGQALRQCPDGRTVPWHRVVNARGRLSLPTGSRGHAVQRARLEREGVRFRGGRIDLERYRWRGPGLDELLWQPVPFPDNTK